jgi:putative FmdB family regulatory protein
VPTYQYACTECGHAFDQVQSFSDDALTECPVCSGRLRKVFNAVGVVFKGSGFYRTDSRTNGSSAAPAASDGSPAPAAAGGKKASGSDAKAPAASTSSSSTSSSSSGSSSSSSSD